MPENPSYKFPHQIIIDSLRLVAFVVSKLLWFIRYNGLENVPANTFGSFIIVANHQTYIDPVWICLPMRRPIRYMAIGKAFDWTFIGRLIRYLGAFPIASEPRSTREAMRSALSTLRDGAALTIFPEGARAFADGRPIPFKTGAVRIAMKAGVPILPVTIRGGNHVWPQGQQYPTAFRRVEITYHPLLNMIEDKTVDLRSNLEIWTSRLEKTIVHEKLTTI